MKMRILLWLPIVAALILGAAGVSAQTRPAVISADQIRTQAGMIRQYKELLASPDASIRYAAVSEMLNSKDNSLRVLAFDMAFQSADSSIRALALKERVLSMGSVVIEPANENVALQLVDKRLGRIGIPMGETDIKSGVSKIRTNMALSSGNTMYGNITVSGEAVTIVIQDFGSKVSVIGKFRLADGEKLVGSIQWTLPNSDGQPASGFFPAFISVN